MNTMNHLLGSEFNSTSGWWSVNTHFNYFVFCCKVTMTEFLRLMGFTVLDRYGNPRGGVNRVLTIKVFKRD